MEAPATERERIWQGLLRRYQRRMVAYARRTNCSGGEAEELVEDAWSVVALHERALLASDDPWVMIRSALCGVCTERIRVWDQEWTSDSMERIPTPTKAEDIPDYYQALHDWWTAASVSLSKNQRLAVDFRYRWGWSFAEIATALGVAEPTARVHVARGMRRLRELIPQLPPPGPSE